MLFRIPESLSAPITSWVKSFEPIENPSTNSANSSAWRTTAGTSAIIQILKFLDCTSPSSAIIPLTTLSSSGVLTNGSITITFVSPYSSLTFLIAWHSSLKPCSYSGEIYLETPLQPIIGLASIGSTSSPPLRPLNSFFLKSEVLTTKFFG